MADSSVNFFEKGDTVKKLKKLYNVFQSEDKNSSEFHSARKEFCELATKILNDQQLKNDPLAIYLLNEIINISRIFPDHKVLSSEGIVKKESIFTDFAEAFYTIEGSEEPIHPYLYDVYEEFNKHKRVVVSAPTSFGKTKLLVDILNNKKFSKTIIILPTNALINELFETLNNHLPEDFIIIRDIVDFRSIQNSTVAVKYIVLFTPEKALELFFEYENESFDFGVMDEVYKISEETGEKDDNTDERIYSISNSLYWLAKRSEYLYCIGPNFNSFRDSERLNAYFLPPVQIDIVSKNEESISGKGTKYGKIAEIIKNARKSGKSTMVYCPLPKETETQARKFCDQLDDEEYKNDEVNQLVEYIDKEITKEHDTWSLVSYLKKGVAFHHGKMPSEIQIGVVDLFNKGKIDVIFCTSTLIEGVNLSAKNIIFYKVKDKNAGDGDKINILKYKNIKGRAGRLGKHFVGNVYTFENDQKDEPEDTDIDVYLKEYSPKREEKVLLQMEESDINPDEKKRLDDLLNEVDDDAKNVIRKNRFIDIKKQINLMNRLQSVTEEEFLSYKNLSLVKDEGEYSSLELVLKQARDYLFNDYHRKKTRDNASDQKKGYVFTLRELAFRYSMHLYSFENGENSLKTLYPFFSVKSNTVDDKIQFASYFITSFCRHALPMYIGVFFTIYYHVAVKRGIELSNEDKKRLEKFTNNKRDLDIKDLLGAFDVPNNTSKKIVEFFDDCKNTIEIRDVYKNKRSKIQRNVTSYESVLLDKLFGYSDK